MKTPLDENTACRRFRVEGKVQGVWFRESTRRQAVKLGLHGHAINLQDGSVEVLVWGPEEGLEALHRWLHKGPPMARVTCVHAHEAQHPGKKGFRTG